jgi:type VI secretion system secreted protein Hcp
MMKAFPLSRILAAALVATFGMATSAVAASDFFLKLDGIDGESTAIGFENTIEASAFGIDVLPPPTAARGSGGGTGKVSVHDISITKTFDKSSPKLMESCAKGTHIKEAKLTCRKAGGGQEPYFVVTMEDVLISSYSTSGASGGDRPMESLSLNFTKVTYEYQFQGAAGTPGDKVVFTYDLKKATK